VSVLLLVRDNTKLAGEVFNGIQSSPFLAQSRFIDDVIYQYIPDHIKTPIKDSLGPVEDVNRTIWETASSVLSNWMQFWLEDSELVNKRTSSSGENHSPDR